MRLILEQGNHQLSIGEVLEVVGSRWVHLPLPDKVSFVMESSARRFVAATLDRLENYILRSPGCEDIRFKGMVIGFEDDLGSVRFDWMIVPTGDDHD